MVNCPSLHSLRVRGLQSGGDIEGAKAHLVNTVLPTIVSVLPFWRMAYAESASYNQVMLLLLEIVSSIYLLPPLEPSMIGTMCAAAPPMPNVVSTLARFCGLNPVLGSSFAEVTVKLIEVECSCCTTEQLRQLARKVNVNARASRERMIQNLCSVEGILDFEEIAGPTDPPARNLQVGHSNRTGSGKDVYTAIVFDR